MVQLVVLQHQELIGPGSLADVAARLGLPLSICRLDQGEPLPGVDQPGQILVILGGCMGVGDRNSACYGWMPAEIELIRQRLSLNLPMLGLCLGAQLLAHAAGGTVEQLKYPSADSPGMELGCGSILWHHTIDQEPELMRGLQRSEPVFLWHGDRVRLPLDATLLASNLVCREQAFRIGSGWGLQFHAEFTRAMAASWIEAYPELVTGAHGHDGVQQLHNDLKLWGEEIEQRNQQLLENLFGMMIRQLRPGG